MASLSLLCGRAVFSSRKALSPLLARPCVLRATPSVRAIHSPSRPPASPLPLPRPLTLRSALSISTRPLLLALNPVRWASRRPRGSGVSVTAIGPAALAKIVAGAAVVLFVVAALLYVTFKFFLILIGGGVLYFLFTLLRRTLASRAIVRAGGDHRRARASQHMGPTPRHVPDDMYIPVPGAPAPSAPSSLLQTVIAFVAKAVFPAMAEGLRLGDRLEAVIVPEVKSRLAAAPDLAEHLGEDWRFIDQNQFFSMQTDVTAALVNVSDGVEEQLPVSTTHNGEFALRVQGQKGHGLVTGEYSLRLDHSSEEEVNSTLGISVTNRAHRLSPAYAVPGGLFDQFKERLDDKYAEQTETMRGPGTSLRFQWLELRLHDGTRIPLDPDEKRDRQREGEEVVDVDFKVRK